MDPYRAPARGLPSEWIFNIATDQLPQYCSIVACELLVSARLWKRPRAGGSALRIDCRRHKQVPRVGSFASLYRQEAQDHSGDNEGSLVHSFIPFFLGLLSPPLGIVFSLVGLFQIGTLHDPCRKCTQLFEEIMGRNSALIFSTASCKIN